MSEITLNCPSLSTEGKTQLLSNDKLSAVINGIASARLQDNLALIQPGPTAEGLRQQFAEITDYLEDGELAEKSDEIFAIKEAALKSLHMGQIAVTESSMQARAADIVDTLRDCSILRISKAPGQALFGKYQYNTVPRNTELFDQSLVIAATIGKVLGYKELHLEYQPWVYDEDKLANFGFLRDSTPNLFPTGPYKTALR